LLPSFDAGKTIDHLTYMSPCEGTADIFFPTDFSLLQEMIRREQRKGSKIKGERDSHANTANIMPSSQFLKQYGDLSQTRTISGYNPMIEDYANTCMLLT
jgi:hypothetical protein